MVPESKRRDLAVRLSKPTTTHSLKEKIRQCLSVPHPEVEWRVSKSIFPPGHTVDLKVQLSTYSGKFEDKTFHLIFMLNGPREWRQEDPADTILSSVSSWSNNREIRLIHPDNVTRGFPTIQDKVYWRTTETVDSRMSYWGKDTVKEGHWGGGGMEDYKNLTQGFSGSTNEVKYFGPSPNDSWVFWRFIFICLVKQVSMSTLWHNLRDWGYILR